jgi:hypothetical protein
MSDKKFKIKPKVWPKEYTFEEFKQLNPNITESLLINYYNKYLQEYAEDRSRHLNHFNDTKDILSKEIKSLNERLITNTGEWSDGDANVGPTGAGRTFRSPLNATKHAVFFDRIDDGARANLDGVGNEPADGTLKPYSQLTVAAWINAQDLHNMPGSEGHFHIATTSKSGGWRLYTYNKRMGFSVQTDDGDDTSTNRDSYSAYGAFKSTGGRYKENGWHYVVGTYDGRYIKFYADGALADGGGSVNNVDIGSQSTGQSGSFGAIYYKESNKKHLLDFSIGSRTDVNTSGVFNAFSERFSGSIAEVAVWDIALDATTIKDIHDNNISGSSPKYDLSYSGYNNGENNSDHPYDVADEGLSYKNVGRYAGRLQGWWKMDENTGTIIKDSSGNKRDLTLYNSPTWSGSHAPY